MKDGGPAFSYVNWEEPSGAAPNDVCEGMSLRDYFAAHATEDDIHPYLSRSVHVEYRETAKYLYADAMLKAREDRNE